MKETLTLRIDLTESPGPSLPARPIQYSILGLRQGEVALIRRLGDRWTIYLPEDGKAALKGRGDFPSATAALAAFHISRSHE